MIKIIFVILTTVLFASCRYKPLDPPPAVNVVKRHQKFSVNLPEDHRKNLTWRLIEGDKKVRELGEAWHGNEQGIDFNFMAVEPGVAELKFMQFGYQDTTTTVCYKVKITDN